MGIFSRFTDIVNANINALLDKAEDPEKMVRLIIQEMEDTLVEVRSTSAKTLAEQKHINRQLQRIKHDIQDWEEKAELALKKDREDLARSALTEKRKLEDHQRSLSHELELLDNQVTKLNDEIAQLQTKLNDARARQKALIQRQRTAESRLSIKKVDNTDKTAEALAKFDQYESRIDDMEAQAESHDLGQKGSLKQEFAELERDERVEDELESLKARLQSEKS